MSEAPDEVAALIADFTTSVSGNLDPRSERAAKAVVMDSIAVAMGALAHPAAQAARRHAARFVLAENGCIIWGARTRTTPEIAALTNGVLLRCYDYNDFFVGERNSGHGSDMVSAVVAAAEWQNVSGAKSALGARRRLRGSWRGLRRVLDRARRLGLHQPHGHRRNLRDRARPRPRCRPDARGAGDDGDPAFRQRRDRIQRAQRPRRSHHVEALQRRRRGAQFAAGVPACLRRRRGRRAAVRRQARLHRQAREQERRCDCGAARAARCQAPAGARLRHLFQALAGRLAGAERDPGGAAGAREGGRRCAISSRCACSPRKALTIIS